MEEVLIEFETAKLANLKGFGIEVRLKKNSHYSSLTGNLDSLGAGGAVVVDHYYAATQSLLQKWLREVHNIHVCAITFDNTKGKYTVCIIFNNIEYYSNRKNQVWFETYEEALEAGLQEALNLI